jgi:hypothetical protein
VDALARGGDAVVVAIDFGRLGKDRGGGADWDVISLTINHQSDYLPLKLKALHRVLSASIWGHRDPLKWVFQCDFDFLFEQKDNRKLLAALPTLGLNPRSVIRADDLA